MSQNPPCIGLRLRGPTTLDPSLQLLPIDGGKGSGEVTAQRGQRGLEQMEIGAGKGWLVLASIFEIFGHDLGDGS